MCLWLTQLAQLPGAEHSRAIELGIEEPIGEFGRGLLLNVRYQNRSEAAWVIREPRQSTNVNVRYGMVRGGAHPTGYSLGERRPIELKPNNGPGFKALISSPPKLVRIEANDAHEFKVTIEREWTGCIVPGMLRVWLVDQSESLESNRLTVPIRFTRGSVTACRGVAADSEETIYKRGWHAAYLKQVMPSLVLTPWQHREEVLPRSQRASVDAAIQKEIARFDSFWQNNANADTVDEAIDKINADAGVSTEDIAAMGLQGDP